jgi:hypothetical protein
VGAWSNVALTNVSYQAKLRGGTEYYYTFRAVNASGDVWASPSWRFTTLGEGSSTVNHLVPYTWLEAQNASWASDYEAAATNDPDNDGFYTWEEYWSGTDPQDTNSFPRIDAVWFDGTNVVFEWQHKQVDPVIPAIAVERTPDVATGTWSYVGEKIPVDGVNTWTGAPLDKVFYRISATNVP